MIQKITQQPPSVQHAFDTAIFFLFVLQAEKLNRKKKAENRQNVGGQTMLSATRKLKPIMRSISRIKSFKSTSKRQKKNCHVHASFHIEFIRFDCFDLYLEMIFFYRSFCGLMWMWKGKRQCRMALQRLLLSSSAGLCKSFERNNCWQKLGKESGIYLWVIHEKPHLASKRKQNNRKKSASSFTFDYNDSNLQRQQILSSCLTTKLLNQHHKHQRCKSWKRDKNEHFRGEKIMPLSIEMKLL